MPRETRKRFPEKGEPALPRTLAEWAIRTVGVREAFRPMMFAARWLHAERHLGRPLESCDEYADWWAQPRATAFRDQQRFRRAFPGYDTPRALLDALPESLPDDLSDDVDTSFARLLGTPLRGVQ